MERQKQLEERAKEEAAGSTGTAVCVKDVRATGRVYIRVAAGMS